MEETRERVSLRWQQSKCQLWAVIIIKKRSSEALWYKWYRVPSQYKDVVAAFTCTWKGSLQIETGRPKSTTPSLHPMFAFHHLSHCALVQHIALVWEHHSLLTVAMLGGNPTHLFSMYIWPPMPKIYSHQRIFMAKFWLTGSNKRLWRKQTLAASLLRWPFHVDDLVNLNAIIENLIDTFFTRAFCDKFSNVTWVMELNLK